MQIGEHRTGSLLAGVGIGIDMQVNPVGRLSGGQKARLGMLVLRLTTPNFYLLDEPTNHLDIEGQEALEAELMKHEASCLLVSHDRSFVRTVGNRFWLIDRKRLVEVEGPEDFFADAGKGGQSEGLFAIAGRKQFRSVSGCGDKPRRAFVEGDEHLTAQLATFVGDCAVGEVAAGCQYRKSRLHSEPIRLDALIGEQSADRIRDLCGRPLVDLLKNPDEFTDGRQRDGDQVSTCQRRLGCCALKLVILDGSSNKNVCVGGYFSHFLARAAADASSICSSDKGRSPGLCRLPKNASKPRLPLAALNIALPSGARSTLTLSPGLRPRWFNTSLRNVTCPLAVTVRVAVSSF